MTADSTAKRGTPKHWWHRIVGILTFIVVLAVLGAIWYVGRKETAKKEREAAEAIRTLGGAVWFSDVPSKSNPDGTPPGPVLLRKLLGDKFFVTAVGANICNDAALAHLKGLPNLEELVLRGPSVTDDGMQYLPWARRLTLLQLWDTKVGDSGLMHLDKLAQLKSLSLSGSGFTDAGLVHLTRLRRLWDLYLNGPGFTAVGLPKLRGLGGLYAISLHGEQIDDKSVDHLKQLTQLGDLNLEGTRITYRGMNELKQALPNCNISP